MECRETREAARKAARPFAARTQAEQDLLRRQVEATDREIDALVYGLCGLTDEEIAVVEGGQ